jgi:hypothetical protein
MKGMPGVVSGSYAIEITRFEKVGEIWFPSEAKYEGEELYDDKSRSHTNGSVKRWNLNLHPDFSKAFELNVPNGTTVFTGEKQVIPLVWRDGKPVARVDEATTRDIDRAKLRSPTH